MLVHVGFALLEDDEGRNYHQRERDHWRQDTCTLRTLLGVPRPFEDEHSHLAGS